MSERPLPPHIQNTIKQTLAVAAQRSAYEDRFIEGELLGVFRALPDQERRDLSRVLAYLHDVMVTK